MKSKSWVLTLVIFVVILIVGMVVAYPMLKTQKTLKVYQPSDVNPKLVDKNLQGVKENHTVGNFSLTNQLGNEVTQNDFENKIYVADFFFATCPSICPIMSQNISELQKEFKDRPEVMFLSHSVTPQIDSVEALLEYGELYGANPERWMLTTGDKKHIYNLARKSYFAVLDEGDGGKQDFIHTENFILVDTKKRLRGFYDGTSESDMERLSEEIEILLEEEFGES
ncbi:MAG: SCO family protein [Flavobacteriales bacterium]|nr:SCO family protein [Flavobacteriales bacterium]